MQSILCLQNIRKHASVVKLNEYEQWRSQEFASVVKRGDLGDRSPPAGSRAEPRWDLEGAKPPEAGDTCNCNNCAIATDHHKFCINTAQNAIKFTL